MRVKGWLVLILAALVVIAAVVLVRLFEGDAERGQVVEVVDGDTVVIRVAGVEERVRLLNVDTPEIGDQRQVLSCIGPQATEFLRRELPAGSRVELDYDLDLRDRYGRLLAAVYVGPTLVNAEIAAAGLGEPVVFGRNDRFLRDVEEAFEEARADGRGAFDPDSECAWTELEKDVEDLVEEAESLLGNLQRGDRGLAADQAAGALIAAIDEADPALLSGGGYDEDELRDLRGRVADLQARARAVMP